MFTALCSPLSQNCRCLETPSIAPACSVNSMQLLISDQTLSQCTAVLSLLLLCTYKPQLMFRTPQGNRSCPSMLLALLLCYVCVVSSLTPVLPPAVLVGALAPACKLYKLYFVEENKPNIQVQVIPQNLQHNKNFPFQLYVFPNITIFFFHTI